MVVLSGMITGIKGGSMRMLTTHVVDKPTCATYIWQEDQLTLVQDIDRHGGVSISIYNYLNSNI